MLKAFSENINEIRVLFGKIYYCKNVSLELLIRVYEPGKLNSLALTSLVELSGRSDLIINVLAESY